MPSRTFRTCRSRNPVRASHSPYARWELLARPLGVEVALVTKSIENGYAAYFVQAWDLLEDLRCAPAKHCRAGCCACMPVRVLVLGVFGSIMLASNRGHAEWVTRRATQ